MDSFLAEQAQLLKTSQRKPEDLATPIPLPGDISPLSATALVDLCLACYNSNEFLYLD